jgi:hypothetical protein
LLWGDYISVKVTATNARGDSLQSAESNSVKILKVPDAPINLFERPSVRTSTTTVLSWAIANENGGTPVIDYRLSFDQGVGVVVTL